MIMDLNALTMIRGPKSVARRHHKGFDSSWSPQSLFSSSKMGSRPNNTHEKGPSNCSKSSLSGFSVSL